MDFLLDVIMAARSVPSCYKSLAGDIYNSVIVGGSDVHNGSIMDLLAMWRRFQLIDELL